jgi:glucose/arabinose dehydrogenase
MGGLRNAAVGLVWRPGTRELWATNNGRDLPFETVYRVSDGGNAGWPRCYPAPGSLRPDPPFGRPEGCPAADAPAVTFQAHTDLKQVCVHQPCPRTMCSSVETTHARRPR